MNRHVLTLSPTQTMEEAAQAMIERKVGSSVVMDRSALVGIVTERDIMRAVARGMVPWNTKIEEIMTRDPVSISPESTTAVAAQTMLKGGFRHLPVVKEGRLVGIVGLRDALLDAGQIEGT
ncbi:MAG: CBS domain-containing protein [Candidatus Methylomirabilales bacterium]